MIAVLDASAAIEFVFGRPSSQPIADVLSSADLVLSPDLYVAEVSNAVWKYARSADQLVEPADVLVDIVSLPDELVSSHDLYREAFAFSLRKNHPVYDSLYAVLARRNDATLLTMDQKLTVISEEEGITVIPTAPIQ
jgi:predicted nucleic acid-binding protein